MDDYNENNNYELNSTKQKMEIKNNYIGLEPRSSIFNLNINNSQKEAENLLREGEEEIIMRERLMFEPQTISLFKIYSHFFEPIDYFFLLLAIIGSLASGITFPSLIYISVDNFSNIGNTQETRNINAPPQVLKMIQEMMEQSIRKSMDKNIKRQLVCGAISFVANFISLTFWALIGHRCAHKFNKNYFKILLSQEQGWFDCYNAYELASKVQAQMDQFEQGIGIIIGITLSAISQGITGFIVAFILSWKATLVMICVSPFVITFYIVLTKILRRGIIIGRKTWEKAGGIAEEMIYNIKTVASFANFEYELKRFYEIVDIVWRIELMNTFKLALFNGLVIFLLYLVIFICYIYGRTLVKKDYNSFKGRDVSGPDIFGAGLCAFVGLFYMSIFAPNLKIIQESCSAASDYFNLYNRKPQMDFSQSIERPPLSQIQGRIEFRGVNFYYPSDPEKRLILNDLNLTFEPGKKIALVGESGCGKTTIVNLIERLYDINGGQLLIDGVEIYKYDIEYLRNFIGYVQQDPVLFDISIRDNIIFGREEFLSSIGNVDELVRNACDESYSSEFINNLNEGLDYYAGIKGNKLSGGQRQRIAIARAILAKPKILILDEATSSLDNISEKEVQQTLDNITLNNITTIIIAHRLSTIKNADLIYVIKDGKVLEKGNHDQLLQENGYYAGLIHAQLAKAEIENLNKNVQQLTPNSDIKRNQTNEGIEFERRDNAIALSDKDIPFNCCTIFGELREYKLDIVLACLGALISGVVTTLVGFFMSKTIIALNSMYETVRYDDGLKYSIIFLAFAFLLGFGDWLSLWKFNSVGLTLSRMYRKKLMEKYLSFHLSYFDVTKNSPGALLTRMSINTMELNQIVNNILGISIKIISMLITAIIIGCIYEYRLYLINLCFMPITIISNIIRRQFIQTSGKKSIMAKMEAGGLLSECIINTKTVFCYNFQRKAISIYSKIYDYIRRQFICDSIIMGFFMGLGSSCYFAANSTVYAGAKKYMIDGSMESEDLAVLMNICNISEQGVINTLGNFGNLRKAVVAFRLIYSTLRTNSLIPPFQRDNLGKQSALNITGKIELRNVNFAYPTRPENVILKNVSLTINPGQQVALVGPSGSGKSTIIQLLNRFYDVEDGKGEILIDDINIKDYNLFELRKKIGYVSQEPSLFKVSALENVRYGRLDASDEECFEAANKANITNLFSKENMNKMIENKRREINSKKFLSVNQSQKDLLSGGEKQRLCIARTFLKNPTILLLDEPTSSLDKNNELEVQKSLNQLSNNKTSISITHRLNTIENCDKIFVIDNGKIIEEGTHQQLIDLKRMYYILYNYS